MDALRIHQLRFSYPGTRPIFDQLEFAVPAGSRTLLVGANGVGKSTLLRLLAGRHLVDPQAIQVLGRPPFHDLGLASEIALVDSDFPVHVDLSVAELLDYRQPGVDPRRERELLEVLGVDTGWRMPRVSEGQRRRVQLVLAIRRPIRLLLLDEITSQLDVVIRSDFLSWLKAETERTALTIVYATHIFEPWPTHVLFLGCGGFSRSQAIDGIEELNREPLVSVCERWIREDLRRSCVARHQLS